MLAKHKTAVRFRSLAPQKNNPISGVVFGTNSEVRIYCDIIDQDYFIIL